MSPRYAVYFAPAKASGWWTFGAHWLGRDECDDRPLPQPKLAEMDTAAQQALTAEPRRYGFHATLKAPFALAPGHDETSLLQRVQALALSLSPVAVGSLEAVNLGSFVALVPAAGNAHLQALAASCVTELDGLRAPLLPAELARRQSAKLDTRGAELLATYGYPHVMERFQFHLTLTGSTDGKAAAKVIRAVASDVDHLNHKAPLKLDRLCVFVESAPGAAFRRIGDALLTGPVVADKDTPGAAQYADGPRS